MEPAAPLGLSRAPAITLNQRSSWPMGHRLQTTLDDIGELAELIRQHHELTGSTIAIRVLEKWDQVMPQFVKVIPTDYQRVLNEQANRDIYEISSDKPPLNQRVAT